MLKRCQNIPDTMSFPQVINHLPGKKGMFTPSCKDQQDEPPAWPWFSEANLTSVTVYHDVSKPFFECLSFSSKTVTPTAGRVYALLIFSPSVPALAYHRNTIRMWLSSDLNANFLKECEDQIIFVTVWCECQNWNLFLVDLTQFHYCLSRSNFRVNNALLIHEC